ncbi:MAG: hypothetical protein OSB19_04960 [Opitutaceae bacterium]|nr:hypothetical protein [Opitutaceae bacterium]
MKINWFNSIYAGIAGTLLFDIVGFGITGQWWDIPGLLGVKLGLGLTGGLAAHYGNGVAIAIIYAALAPSLFGPSWFRALSFITVQTVMGVWLFMLPLLGAGIAGFDMNPWMPLITLTRHFAYAIPLILLISVSISPKETKPLRVLESQTV